MSRDLVSIDDLADDELMALLDVAEEMARGIRARTTALQGVILATLFLEPSTRTRLSFEAAMHRLGGSVITSADPATSSTAKGETLVDTIRMVDGYADVIVLRHSAAGAAQLAAEVARAPVINAGDGGREHPTQTLVDLFTLRRECGQLSGLTVMLYGDLRFGRTTHSLARGLVRLGARIIALAEPELGLPEYVQDGLCARGNVSIREVEIDGLGPAFGGPRLARVIEPAGQAGAAGSLRLEKGELNAVYATRIQRERIPAGMAGGPALPRIDEAFLAGPAFSRAVILHPLPRVNEIDPAIDGDPRAGYFRQAAAGVPVRMAVLGAAVGIFPLPRRHEQGGDGRGFLEHDRRCEERACISTREPHATPPRFLRDPAGRLRCAYCEHPVAVGEPA